MLGWFFSRYFWVIVLFATALVLVRCAPEKDVDISSKLVPVKWVSEEILIARRGGDLFQFNGKKLKKINYDANLLTTASIPELFNKPNQNTIFFTEQDKYRSHQYINIEGEKHRVRRGYSRRALGMNQGFPKFESIEFYSYHHLGEIGLLTFRDDHVQKRHLPLSYKGNQSAPIVIPNQLSNMFFAYQSGCSSEGIKGICYRSGWVLDKDLVVQSHFQLPADDILYVKEKLSCFSCGCGCYTQEQAYAVGDKVYMHIAGFPIKDSKRGLYQIVGLKDGETEWKQVIKGRIEPPLAFSPSGCMVAYYKVSYFGDNLKVKNFCD